MIRTHLRLARWAGVLAAGAAVLAAPAIAFAAPGGTGHTVTETEHIHGDFSEPEFATNPCNGADIVTMDAFGNVVSHVTFFPGGDEVWATFTEEGKATVVDATGVTYTGHFTAWGNFNQNEQNTNNSFTLSVKLDGDDGSSITMHEVQHFAANANGDVTVNFDRPSLTCG